MGSGKVSHVPGAFGGTCGGTVGHFVGAQIPSDIPDVQTSTAGINAAAAGFKPLATSTTSSITTVLRRPAMNAHGSIACNRPGGVLLLVEVLSFPACQCNKCDGSRCAQRSLALCPSRAQNTSAVLEPNGWLDSSGRARWPGLVARLTNARRALLRFVHRQRDDGARLLVVKKIRHLAQTFAKVRLSITNRNRTSPAKSLR